MEQSDLKAFSNIMATAYRAFGDKEPDQARLAIYFDFLKDIPIRTIGDAVNKILMTRKYSSVPTIAEIRDAALGGDADIKSAALGYWARATRLISRSQYGDGDKVLDEMIEMSFGSWSQFGETEMDNTPSDRKHFLACAEDILRRHPEYLKLTIGGEVKKLGE
jgi:hypothetical protein